MKALPILLLSVPLAGCISFSSSEAPVPEYVNACANKEQQCRDLCGNNGVQVYSCDARPGEGFSFKCECRKSGATL